MTGAPIPPLFILTSGGSGGTLLRVMLAGHDQLFAPPELNLLPFASLKEMEETLGTCPSHSCAGGGCDFRVGLLLALMNAKGIDSAGSQELVERWIKEDYSIPEVFEALCIAVAPKRLVDKSPLYALRSSVMRRAERLFDGALYVHLIRHPVPAIAARLAVGMPLSVALLDGPDRGEERRLSAAEVAELFWRSMNRNIHEFLSEVPSGRWQTIRFEDLVRSPSQTMVDLCSFLGIPYSEALLWPYAGDRMRGGLAPGSRAPGNPEFHDFARIEPREADRWRVDRVNAQLEPATICMASQLGYDTW